MDKTKRKISYFIILFLAILLMVQTPQSLAKTPHKEEVKYKGGGIVEVEFYNDVQWKNIKVRVKDNKNQKYKTSIVKYDDDEIKFKIKKYKRGKKYSFKISKVREYGTKKYGTVRGKVTIPKKTKSISLSKAKKIALNNAVRKYNIKKSTVNDLDIEKDYYGNNSVWEVSFEAKKKNGYWCDYEYKIKRSNGKILYSEQEYD